MKDELFSYLGTIIQLQQELLQLLLGRQMQVEEWLDSVDVKNRLKISDRTLHRLRSTGQLSARKVGGKWYYPQSELLQKMQDGNF